MSKIIVCLICVISDFYFSFYLELSVSWRRFDQISRFPRYISEVEINPIPMTTRIRGRRRNPETGTKQFPNLGLESSSKLRKIVHHEEMLEISLERNSGFIFIFLQNIEFFLQYQVFPSKEKWL